MCPRFPLITGPGPLDREARSRLLAATAREIPAIAMEGFTAVRDVMASGARGVAVVAGVRKDHDPPDAVWEIAELVHTA